MAGSPSYPFLVRQGQTWHARLDISAGLRPEFGGKRSFSRSTKLAEADQAFHRAKPWLDAWKA